MREGILMWLLLVLVTVCPLVPPVQGPVARPFAPVGRFAGHWGVDLAVPVGTPVSSPMSGVVTFAGSVAGTRSVTVQAGEWKATISSLASIRLRQGDRVQQGEALGRSGLAHGEPAVHLSLRRAGAYVDPATGFACTEHGTVRLLPPDPVWELPYAAVRSHRTRLAHGWNGRAA